MQNDFSPVIQEFASDDAKSTELPQELNQLITDQLN